MKKIVSIIIAVTTIFSLGMGFALAQGLTTTQPPIIPIGTNDQKNVSQTPGQPEISTLKLPGAGTDNQQELQQLVLPNITNIVIALTGGLSLLFVIIAGIQILTAYGNEEKFTEAKKTITWALVGLVISLLSYAIVQILVSINIGGGSAPPPTPPPSPTASAAGAASAASVGAAAGGVAGVAAGLATSSAVGATSGN